MRQSAQADSFVRDHLPPVELWPRLDFSLLPELQYPERLNAASILLERAAHPTTRDQPALRFPGGQWSYRELLERVNRIANLLTDQYALQHGQRVLLRAPNNALLVACWFAVLKAGGVVVCTMPLLRVRELRFILEHARINLCITDARIADELRQAIELMPRPIPLLTFGNGELESLLESTSSEFRAVDTAGADPAIIAYTSGTTGAAKGTVHFHRDLIAVCDCWSKHVLRPEAADVFCGSPPLAFTFGLGALVLFPLRAGASTLLLEQCTPPHLLEAIPEHRPTILFTSPTAYRAMLSKLEGQDLSSLTKCVSAGEALPLATFEAWQAATGLAIIDGIGATELLHIFISASGADIRAGSTGKTVPGYEACVVDEQMQEVARGMVGKLAVRGPTGCRYLDNEERQRAYVRGGWNLTGDAYTQDREGYFWYQARADDMIVSSGYNIAGPEVENVLLEHADVLECGVVGVPDAERGHVVKAFVVLRPGCTGDAALTRELQDYVKTQIAPYKYPRQIEFVDRLPRTNTGKLQRFRLREQNPE